MSITKEFQKMMKDIDQTLGALNFEDLSSGDGNQFTEVLKGINFSDKSIQEIRDAQKKLNKFGINLTKKDIENRFCTLLVAHLMEEERSRPLDEQFPFVRNDIDKLVESVNTLRDSTRNLLSHNQNRSNEPENLVKNGLIDELKSDGWNIDDLGLRLGDGVIIKKDGDSLVQWDAIIEAIKGSEKRLYLVETKETCHKNDIFGDQENEKSVKKSLYNRSLLTISFLEDIDNQLKSGTTPDFQNQCKLLKDLKSHSIFLCYASRHVREDVKKELKNLKQIMSDDISVNALEFGTKLKISKFE